MTIKQRLTEIFENNRGEYFSGEQLAQRLNVTRAAVWKAVSSMRSDGFDIQAESGRGYMLTNQNDALSQAGIKKYLTAQTPRMDINVYREVDSTNNVLRRLAQEGAKEGTVAVALSQTAGRGRKGRGFYSPSDTGLYLSILLRPKLPARKAALITTAAAVAVCEALESMGAKPGIKWVNDVFINGKKVCGILTEASLDVESGSLSYAVLGVGINVYMPGGDFPDELKDIAGGAFNIPIADARNKLAAAFLRRFMTLYMDLESPDCLEQYRRRCFVIGSKVSVVKQESVIPATVLNVDDEYHLVVRYEDETTEELSSGEISLKAL